MLGVVVGADHHVVSVGGAAVTARGHLEARIAPLAHHGQFQPDGRDGQVADVAPAVDVGDGHLLLRVQLRLDHRLFVLRLVLNGLGQGLFQFAQGVL